MIKHWFYLVGFLDLLGVSAVVPMIPQHLKDMGISPSIIGLYGSLYGAIQLFSSPIVGHMTDRHGRLHVLFICISISSFAYTASSTVINHLLVLALLRCMLGIFKHTQDLCRSSLAEKSNAEEKTKCIGQYNAISSVGFIIGPIISGFAAETLGLANAVTKCLLLCSLLFMINALVIRFVVQRYVSTAEKPSPTVNIAWKSRSIFTLITEVDWKVHGCAFLSRFLLAFAVMIYRSSFVLGLKNSYPSMPSSGLGYLLSYNALIGFVIGLGTSWTFAHRYYAHNEEKLQLHAAALISVGLLLVSLARSIPVLMLGLAVLVVGTSASRACGITLTIKRSSTEEMGKLLGLNASIISIARSGAPFVAGLSQEYSYSAPPYIALLISLVGSWLFYWRVYSVPQAPTADKTK